MALSRRVWNRRFLHLRGHYGFHATACTPATPREKGSVEAAVRYLKTGFWPAPRFADLRELDERYDEWRDRTCNRRTHASGCFPVAERLGEERQAIAMHFVQRARVWNTFWEQPGERGSDFVV